jgi:hypothetical protein
MTRLFFLLTTVSLLIMSAQAAYAASVTITPAAAGTYSIQGDAMDGVAGIELTLNYDVSLLASPTVSQGSLVSGALLAANINSPGYIKIAIISSTAFSGSGQIATVTFATQNGTGGITSASVSMINSKGSPITAQVVVSSGNATAATAPGLISTPGIPFSQPGAATTAAPSAASAAASSVPTDVQPRSDTNPVDTTDEPAGFTEPAVAKPVEQPEKQPDEAKPAAEPQKPMEVKQTSYKGALDYFRAYKGEKSPAILIALFNKEITPAIRQEPLVYLSDGKTPLKILVKLATVSDKSPNFSLNGAKLVSLNRDASSVWIIEALPQAGIVRASLTVLTESDIIEYPLTLAPPFEGVSSAEAGFAVFLKDSGAKTPKRDLNGDGIHDYLDDFIYTANYLKRKATAGKINPPEPVLTAETPSPSRAPTAEEKKPEQERVFYTLLAGETVSRSKLGILLKKLKSSGLQPVVREENKSMDVYRLVTECFSAKAAAQKSLTDLVRKEKEAFIVHDAGQSCVVAGSFFSHDDALAGQDRLAKKDLRTEIVKAHIPLTTWQVTIGRYNDSQSAAAELKRLAELGIDVVVTPLDINTANYPISKGAAGKVKKSEPVLTADTPSPSRAPSAEEKKPEQERVFYTLLAGETVSRSKLGILIKKLEASGLQPVVREENKTREVHRLVTECFSAKASAQKRLTDLARKEKEAFIVHDAGQSCVVAASYFSYDAALAGQNSLAEKSLRTEIVKAHIPLTIWQVTIGRYNDVQSATVELKRLAELGIDVVVVLRDR